MQGVARKNFRGRPKLEGAKTNFQEGVIRRVEGAREKFACFAEYTFIRKLLDLYGNIHLRCRQARKIENFGQKISFSL